MNRGGGVVLDCNFYQTGRLWDYFINRTTFTNNIALEGGAFYWDTVKIQEENITFKNNTAKYGSDAANTIGRYIAPCTEDKQDRIKRIESVSG